MIDPDRLFAAVANGENVVVAANRLGYPLDELLECLYDREGEYRMALKKVPRRMTATYGPIRYYP